MWVLTGALISGIITDTGLLCVCAGLLCRDYSAELFRQRLSYRFSGGGKVVVFVLLLLFVEFSNAEPQCVGFGFESVFLAHSFDDYFILDR